MADDDSGKLINVNIDTSGLSEPGKLLVEKVSDAVGAIARPGLTVLNAKADAKAEIVRAEAQIQLTEIQRRGLERMVVEEGKRQENIENITEKAIPHLSADAKPDEVDDDWITHFFDRCRLVSDEEMQSLWGRILSGQANEPGSFSKKTIELVGTLDKTDAEFFAKFCSFVWMIGRPTPLIMQIDDKVYEAAGLNFDSISHLADIGLVTFGGITGYERRGFGDQIRVHYFGRPVVIDFGKVDNTLDIGKVILTRAGIELCRFCEASPNFAFFDRVLDEWIAKGYAISCPIDSKAAHQLK